MFDWFLDLIYKKKCPVCGCSKTHKILCKTCLKSVHKLPFYAQRLTGSIQIFSAYRYDDIIKKLIRNLKFHNKKSASVACAKLLFDYFSVVLKENNLNIKDFVLVPVPSHFSRVFRRGYCHTELIAREFSKLSGIETNFKVLKKVRNTLPQYKIPAKNKRENVRGAYNINTKYLPKKEVLLFDDLVTSGATFEEIISVFKAHGVENILGLTLAC